MSVSDPENSLSGSSLTSINFNGNVHYIYKMLNAEQILIQKRVASFMQVTDLNLSSLRLTDVSQLRYFSQLKTLVLTDNLLQRAHETSNLQCLVSLDISGN